LHTDRETGSGLEADGELAPTTATSQKRFALVLAVFVFSDRYS
jgi:hypothetical protein